VGLHMVRSETILGRCFPVWGRSRSRTSSTNDEEEVMKFSPAVQEIIRKRAKDRCEVCTALAMYHQIHHRRPRGMGGSKDPMTGSAANALWVHPHCHARIESNREEAYERGWLVRQGMDPSTIPVKMGMLWYLLSEDGTTMPTNPST